MSTPKINPVERRVLKALCGVWCADCDFCYLGFKGIGRRTRLSRKLIRRACRSLRRKGLAEYGRGLWTEDGEVAGSGYAATRAGALIEVR